MKYHILSRQENPIAVLGEHTWHYAVTVDTFEEVEILMERQFGIGKHEYKIIYGEELEWEIEKEEVTYKRTEIKSKKLKKPS